MKITNDGQFSNLYKGTISFPYKANDIKPTADYSVKSHPLISKSWVTVNKRSKGQRPRDSYHADYRFKRIGNVWIDVDKPKMSDTVKAQWELYRKLKKDYEKQLKIKEVTKERNKSVLRTSSVQNVYQNVNGGVVSSKRFVDFDASKYSKIA